GWAPILAQAMAAKGLNRARQAGACVSDVVLAQAEDAARIAFRTGSWPRAMSRPMPTAPARSSPGDSKRPRTTAGASPEFSGWDRSTADAGEEAGRRSLLGGNRPASSTPAARDGEEAGRRSLLASDGPAPAPAAGGDAARERGDAGRPTELSAATPVPPLHRHGRKIGGAAGSQSRMGRHVDADVPLYSWAACLGILQDSLNTGRAELPRLREQAAHSGDPEERSRAAWRVARVADAEQLQPRIRASLVARLNDPRFLAGAGVKGGEEFLSYMTIAEGLAVRDDDAWRRWDAGMTGDLYLSQNADGSWSGYHCITGRTFSTAAALLTLMADRTPVPVPARATTSLSESR
ncbi:MAG TPA: hypothetical protein VKW77_08905, partial [Acidimicrobiales bacterium]|nr:hypothetical protein [Acidimicrobiales bacterium]